MKAALSLIFIFSLGTMVSAQQVHFLPSGEQVQINQFADKENYSFSRINAEGKLLESGNYKSGMPDGFWVNYNENGSISGTPWGMRWKTSISFLMAKPFRWG